MSARPTISVALAAYNGAHYIQEQLESIFAQSYLPDEVIVCDDASSDTTVAHLDSFQQRFPDRLHIYRNEQNLGYTHNFEKAISFCTGEIIVLSDQDDRWLPNKLERLVALLQQNPQTGLVFSDADVTDQSLHPKGYTVYSHYAKPDLRPGKIAQTFVRQMRFLGCTCAFRAKYLPYLLPISSRWGHDHWIAFILSVISQLEMTDESLMLYRRHDKNAGNAAAWNGNVFTNVLHKRQNLSTELCERSYLKWQAMLGHLVGLQALKSSDFSDAALADGIATVKAKVEFDEYRLAMRYRPRFLRLLPALHLYRSGDYARYTPGSRTFIKDLIA